MKAKVINNNEIINNKNKKRKLPPKGTAARALMAAGLLSHLSEDELEKFRNDIISSRKSGDIQ